MFCQSRVEKTESGAIVCLREEEEEEGDGIKKKTPLNAGPL